MDQRVSLRRYILTAVLAGATLCGTLGWSSVASARDPAGTPSKASVALGHSSSVAARTEPRVATTAARIAPASRATAAAPRTSITRSTSIAGAGAPARSVSTHLAQARALPSYNDKKTWSH